MNKEIERLLKETCINTITKRNTKKCPDQLVGKLLFNQETCEFEFIKKVSTFNNVQGMKRTTLKKGVINESNAIIIILESPHIDEYKDGAPIGPANGKTGDNINKYLCNILSEAMLSKVIMVNPKTKKYDLILINAIRYQCSLGVDTSLFRDFCFMKLWEKKKTVGSFNRRLNIILDNYKNGHIILINGCTLGGHSDLLTVHKGKITKKYLKEIKYDDKVSNKPSLKAYVSQEVEMILKGTNIKQHYISHPSGWHFLNNQKLKNKL